MLWSQGNNCTEVAAWYFAVAFFLFWDYEWEHCGLQTNVTKTSHRYCVVCDFKQMSQKRHTDTVYYVNRNS